MGDKTITPHMVHRGITIDLLTDRTNVIGQRIITGIAIPINNDSTISMSSSFNVTSYNCRGFPKTAGKLWEKPSIKLLLEDSSIDVICLLETF